MSMEDLEADLATWHSRRYGGNPVDLLRTLVKAQEELGECARAILRGEKSEAREEAADVAIVLVHMVRGLGGSLFEEMKAKHQIIEARLKEKS